MANRTIRVVVSCSNKKKLAAPDDLKINNYQDNLSKKIKLWNNRLNNPATKQYPALEMYQGAHWSVAKQIHGFSSKENLDVELWIASAGYGLIKADTLIESYDATFAKGSKESVADEGKTQCWDLLALRKRSHAANLTALAVENPDDFLAVALSETYLKALETDLLNVASLLPPEQLFLISASATKEHPELSCFHLSADARLVNALGGNLISLNARIALHLLEKETLHKWDRSKIDEYFYELTESQLPFKKFKREKMTDDQIISFITEQITVASNKNGKVRFSQSQLLRRLRDTGRACEQTRFRRIFQEIV